jgi:protocatechuate 3,4-dioxygenase beta subunit
MINYNQIKMPTSYKILCFFLLIHPVSSCAEKQQNRVEIQTSTLTQQDGCDSPDADIECYFINMPETLESTMIIPSEGETSEELIITGTIFKADGKTPYQNVILYAYHTDSKGYYSKRGNETGVQKWHGKLHGWCKTDSSGRYTIKTIRPAPYPNNSIPAHIHSAIKMPDNSMVHINDFVFTDDPLIDEKYKSAFERQVGGTGIIELKKTDDTWIGQRDIVLED